MKEHHKPAKTNGVDDVRKNLSNVGQIFVLNISAPDNSFQIITPPVRTASLILNDVKDVFSDPPLRPPIASSLS